MHLPEKPNLKKEIKDLVSIPQPCNMHLIEDQEFFLLENGISSFSQRCSKASIQKSEGCRCCH